MNETRSRYWFSILLYTAICMAFLGLLFFVAEAFFPKTSAELIPRNDDFTAKFMSDGGRWRDFNRVSQKETLANPLKEKIMLVINRDRKIGKSKIVYRGLDGDAKLSLDVAILDLDPHAYYRYRIPISDAEKGFRLVGQNFKLISARKSAIQLWHMKK